LAWHRIYRFSLNLIFLSSFAFLCSCAAPLGPSYSVEKQKLAVHFTQQSEARLGVEAHFQLMASGTQPLDSIEIRMPDEKTFPIQDLSIALDGHDVSLAPAADRSDHAFRLRFDSPWRPRQRQNLVVRYTVGPHAESYSPISSSGFVALGNWYPSLLPPKGMFAKLATEFNKWDFEIRVPEGFLVHANARLRGSKKGNGEVTLHVQQQADGAPFVVAGRYQQQIARASENQIIFWTTHPLPADSVREASVQIARFMEIYRRLFGTRFGARNKGKGSDTIWVAECPYRNPQPVSSAGDGDVHEVPGVFCDTSLPDMVLLTPQAWESGVASKFFQENVNSALAYIWLGRIIPSSATLQRDFSIEGLYQYAAEAVHAEQADAKGRRDIIARYLAAYGKKAPAPAETTPKPSSPKAAIHLQDAWLEKSVLFFFALEDQYGPDHLHRAIARMVLALGEQGYNRNDLRSALESETNQNAADFFRRWLDEPGIPKDFSEHYRASLNLTNTSFTEVP
jgi:hypothetical protein